MDDFAHVELLGMELARLSRDQLVDEVFASLDEGRGGWIITANLDHLQRFVSEPELHPLYEAADLITADGAPLLWAARLQRTPFPDRVAGSDLVWLLAERAAREGRSLYLLGGERDAARSAAEELCRRWPALKIAGHSSPWVKTRPTSEEVEEVRRTIEAAAPDIVYVGLGAPKQEHLIHALHDTLPRAWWMGVGISLSFMAGDVHRAPIWMQKTGLEWVHRMVQEPGRLARRYLLNNLPFALRLLWSSWRKRG